MAEPLNIPDDWTPTADNINALPMPLRRWIMLLETEVDSSGTLQENFILKEQVRQLQAMLEREREP